MTPIRNSFVRKYVAPLFLMKRESLSDVRDAGSPHVGFDLLLVLKKVPLSSCGSVPEYAEYEIVR